MLSTRNFKTKKHVYTSNHEFGPDEQKSLDIVVVAVFQPALNKVSRMKQESIQTMMIKHHLATPSKPAASIHSMF